MLNIQRPMKKQRKLFVTAIFVVCCGFGVLFIFDATKFLSDWKSRQLATGSINKRNVNFSISSLQQTFLDMAASDSYKSILDDEMKHRLIRRDLINQKVQQSTRVMVSSDNDKAVDDGSILFNIETWDRTTLGGLSNEDRLFLASIYGKANSVFEYGLGESTYIAETVHVPRYAGIDSDVVWVDSTRKAVTDHFRFYYGDLGTTKFWGYPADEKLSKIQYQYQVAPLESELLPFDVYMVDGRYRVACALLSFLHASALGNKDPIVLLHDCYQEKYSPAKNRGDRKRISYQVMDEYFTLYNHSGGVLCAFKRPDLLSDETIYKLWTEYRTEVN